MAWRGWGNAPSSATRSLSVSSTCTVFAESEVVSLIASGAAPEEIAWGVRLAISERIASLRLPLVHSGA
jgi:activator of 2-hydroxyglutaryl-CoA dehydratase